MPLISVLMPCYNAAVTLPETLASIVSQTCTDFEVLLVDDGSTDDTRQVLQAWAQQDQRFRCLPMPHAGIIPALNYGLMEARGEYIARMDADDLMHPQRLALQAEYLDAHPDTALVSCLVQGFPEGELREGFRIYIDWLNALTTHEDISREIFVESPLCHPSVMFRQDTVLDLGGYQERGWPEDYDLWLRMYLANMRFAKLPQVLLEWREHPQRLTRTDSRYSLENFIRAKANYLVFGPLRGRREVFIWGAGMHGKRISKHLLAQDVPLEAFIDIDPDKIGRTRRGFPIIAPEELPQRWNSASSPALLAAVGSRGARELIREQLADIGLVEGKDWWGVA